MSSIDRFYVDKVSDITTDQKSGIAKITFGVDGPKGGDVVQLVISAGRLHEMFGQIGETMQKTFGGNRPGGPGGKGPGGAGPRMKFKDVTE